MTMTMEKLKRIVLSQAEAALRNAWVMRESNINVITEMTLDERRCLPQTQLVQADAAYEERLSITAFVAKLYCGVYSHQPHRLKRLEELLGRCIVAADRVRRAIPASVCSPYSLADPRARVGYLETSFDLLRGCTESIRMLTGETDVGDNVLISRARDLAITDQTEVPEDDSILSPMQVSPGDYLKQASRYDWRRDAPLAFSNSFLADEGEACLFLERLEVQFQHIKTSESTLFQMDRYAHELSGGHSGINAVFLSLGTGWRQDSIQYGTIRSAVIAASKDSTAHKLNRYHHTPSDIAIAMKHLQLDVGFVFPEEQSVVVWPLGKTRLRSTIILAQFRGDSTDTTWRYSAIKLLNRGKSQQGESWQPADMPRSIPYPYWSVTLGDDPGPFARRSLLTSSNRWMQNQPSESTIKTLEFYSSLREPNSSLQEPVTLQLGPGGCELNRSFPKEGLGRYLSLLNELLGVIAKDRITDGFSANDVDAIEDFMSTFHGSANGGKVAAKGCPVAWPLATTQHDRVTKMLFDN